MADHIRKQIRGAVATLLTSLSTTGARVYKSRVYALDPDLELPALLIYTPNEDSGPADGGGSFCTPGTMERQITVAVEALAMATANVDDTLDQIAKEVEVKVATDATLSGKVKSLKLTNTVTQFAGGDSQKPVGSLRMTWLAKVQTVEGTPDVAV